MRIFKIVLMVISINSSLKAQELPVVIGNIQKDSLAAIWQGLSSVNYMPDSVRIKELRPHSGEIKVEIFLGTWCDDSFTVVPQMIEVLKKCKIPFLLIGVDRQKSCPYINSDACAEWDITHVPTMKVYRNNKFIGSVVEYPTETIEADLLKIIESE